MKQGKVLKEHPPMKLFVSISGSKFRDPSICEVAYKDTIKVKKTSEDKYVLQDDVLIGQTYLRNGDEIRIEKISDNEIDKMISIIKNKIKMDVPDKTIARIASNCIFANQNGRIRLIENIDISQSRRKTIIITKDIRKQHRRFNQGCR